MKKVLSAALALGMLVGVASTASASYDKFEIRGYYEVEGVYESNTNMGTSDATVDGVNLGLGNVDTDNNSAWLMHQFRLYPTLTVNDKIKMVAEIRLLDDTVWGGNDNNDGNNYNTATGGQGNPSNPDNVRGVDINKLYMTYASPVGTFAMGRIPFGSYGTSKFNDSAGRTDGIKWSTNFLAAPMKMTLIYAKQNEQDAYTDQTVDFDLDWYSIHLDYKQDNVAAGARLVYRDDQDSAGDDFQNWMIQAYAKLTSDNFWIETEISHTFGDHTYDVGGDLDQDEWALILHGGTSFGKLKTSLVYWWISGDDDGIGDAEDSAWGDAGNDWQPLMIVTGEETGMLNNKERTSDIWGVAAATGVHMIGATFDYPVSDKMSVNSVIGTGWLDQEEAIANDLEDHMGWEIDLGMKYMLLDNLTYSLNFGYFDAGDALTDENNGADASEGEVLMIRHKLNMTF